jgi:hypothetical protein
MKKLNLVALFVIATSGLLVAQTFKSDYATKLVLAGAQTSTANTLTVVAPSLTSGWTFSFPAAPAGTNGFVLTGNTDGTTSWASAGSLSVTLGGDVTGPSGSNTVVQINGVPLGATTATSGNVLIADGSQWVSSAMSGDATIDATGALTIAANAVTYAKMQATSVNGVLLGSPSAGTAVGEITVGTGLSLTGTTLSASGFSGSLAGDITGTQSATQINPTNTGIGNRLISGVNTATSGTINGDLINIDNTTLTTTASVLKVNLANANTWTGSQTFGGIALTSNAPTALAANTNDWALSTAHSYFKVSSSANVNVTGIANGADGRVIMLVNTGANNLVLLSENAGSTAANRFHFPGGDSIIIGPDGSLTLIYDSGLSRWKFVSAN